MTKNRRRYSRRKNSKRRILITAAAVITALLVLIPSGIMLYLYMNPLTLKSTVIGHELTKPFDPWENIEKIYFGDRDSVEIDSRADTGKIGDYPVTYTCHGRKYDVTVQVRDTTPPALKVRPYTTDLAEELTPELFVESTDDATEVTVQFKDGAPPAQEGTFEIPIAAVDSSGNETVENASLTRIKDSAAPSLAGADNVELLQGRTMDFEDGISIKDDMDPSPKYSVNADKVDFATPGIYDVVYTVTDRSGNTADIIRKVTIKPDKDYDRKIVYLTFDDGPSDNTEKILDILSQYNAKGTFFVTGNNQKKNDVLKRIVSEGSAIGLHTYTHDYAEVYASEDAYFADLQKISDMVKEVTGVESHIIRFPGGSSNTVSAQYSPGLMTTLAKEVQNRGYQYFDWNCDSTDASGNNIPAETLVKNATSSEAKHINILMHDTDAKGTTVEALPDIIEYYRSKGYAFEPLTVDSAPVHHTINN